MGAVEGIGGGDEMKASDGTLTYIYNFTVKHIQTQQGYNGFTNLVIL